MSKFSRLRQKAGLSISQAAKRTGYAERTVYRWENGETEPKKAVFDLFSTFTPEPKIKSGDFTFIDLFAGIGGLRAGFESIDGRCVFTSEWNTYSQKTYRENFECGHDIAGDI